MMGMPCVKRGGKMVGGFTHGAMVFKLPDADRHARRSRSKAPTSSTPASGHAVQGVGRRPGRPRRSVGALRRARPPSSGSLTEPTAGFLVAEDARVLPGLEHEVEVAPVDRVLRPPAVDDPPFLAQERHRLPVDAHRHADRARLDERRPWRVEPAGYSSRGTTALWIPGSATTAPPRQPHTPTPTGARPHLLQAVRDCAASSCPPGGRARAAGPPTARARPPPAGARAPARAARATSARAPPVGAPGRPSGHAG